MDFGDILDRWDSRKPVQAEKHNEPDVAHGGKVQAQRVNPIEAWIRSNGIFDKDQQPSCNDSTKAEHRRRLHLKKPDAIIDIHGQTRDEAWETMEQFFGNSKRQGFEKILVIHGKGIHSQGEAVLKKSVREFIERCPFAGESGQDKTGGSGATWVLIK